MAILYSEIQTEVQTKSKRTDKSSRIATLLMQVLRKMSRAQTEDGEVILFECLKETASISVVENDYYKSLASIASDFVCLIGVDPEFRYDTDKGYPMNKLDWEAYQATYPNIANNTSRKTKPYDYAIFDSNFYFGPKADDSYTIILPYQKLHPTVTSDSTPILFPEEFREIIRDGILEELWDDLEQYDKSQKCGAQFINGLRSLGVIQHRTAGMPIIGEYNDL